MNILSKPEYEEKLAQTRDARMGWWRKAKFGMFIHIGLYSQLGRNEWARAFENIPRDEYEKLADNFMLKEGCCREWAKLAKSAGMKYMVLTTRHHEGFSLWDSKVNPFNSVNYGCKRDIVKEFVEACREYGLGIGFYSFLMDWHHEDGYKCAYDNEARRRFLDYIEALNVELLSNYGKIDILWYDVANPMQSWEGWDSLERNQRLRELQPDIIINDRSRLDEDFGTPEGHVTAGNRDWEACMTFNDISWGYLDDKLTIPYAYTAQRIARMLFTCSQGNGNLLLNIGPGPDGSIPQDAIEPLTKIGEWLKLHEEVFYTQKSYLGGRWAWPNGGSGTCSACSSVDLRHVYLWNWILPHDGKIALGGYKTSPKSIKIVATGEELPFRFDEENQRILISGMVNGDKILGITMLDVEFENPPEYHPFSKYPKLKGGKM